MAFFASLISPLCVCVFVTFIFISGRRTMLMLILILVFHVMQFPISYEPFHKNTHASIIQNKKNTQSLDVININLLGLLLLVARVVLVVSKLKVVVVSLLVDGRLVDLHVRGQLAVGL